MCLRIGSVAPQFSRVITREHLRKKGFLYNAVLPANDKSEAACILCDKSWQEIEATSCTASVRMSIALTGSHAISYVLSDCHTQIAFD